MGQTQGTQYCVQSWNSSSSSNADKTPTTEGIGIEQGALCMKEDFVTRSLGTLGAAFISPAYALLLHTEPFCNDMGQHNIAPLNLVLQRHGEDTIDQRHGHALLLRAGNIIAENESLSNSVAAGIRGNNARGTLSCRRQWLR